MSLEDYIPDDFLGQISEKSKKIIDDGGANEKILGSSISDNNLLGKNVEENNEETKSEWEDIFESKELCRKILINGKGERKPVAGELVTLRVEGELENGRIVDCYDELSFLVGHSEVIPAFDLCVLLMHVGEIDTIRSAARFAYGKVGKKDEIEPNATVIYTIELLSIEDGPNFDQMNIEERLKWAEKKKLRGNYYFLRDEFTNAIDVYRKALKILEPDTIMHEETPEEGARLKESLATLYNNLAAAQLKIGAWDAVIKSANRCTTYQPHNAKAYFRAAKAYFEKKQFDDVIRQLQSALSYDSNNKVIQAELDRARLMKKVEHGENMAFYKRMFPDSPSSLDTKPSFFKRFIDLPPIFGLIILAMVAVVFAGFVAIFVKQNPQMILTEIFFFFFFFVCVYVWMKKFFAKKID